MAPMNLSAGQQWRHRLVDPVGEVESGTNCENSIGTYTRPYVK